MKFENIEYKQIDVVWGLSIDDVVNTLLQYKSIGSRVCVEFNGVMLYSDTVTLDGAYKEITGMTRQKFMDKQRRDREEWNRKEREHKEKISQLTQEWIKKGHAILDEKYWELWDECVPIRLGDLYRGMELGHTLEIVERLNAGCDFSEARTILDKQGHSGMSFGLMRSMIRSFCDRGEEFVGTV